MDKRAELEQRINEAKKEKEKYLRTLDKLSSSPMTIGDDLEKRVRRIEQYLASNSLPQKYKNEYSDKRLATIKAKIEVDEELERYKKQLNEKYNESIEYIDTLEKEIEELSEEEKDIKEIEEEQEN